MFICQKPLAGGIASFAHCDESAEHSGTVQGFGLRAAFSELSIAHDLSHCTGSTDAQLAISSGKCFPPGLSRYLSPQPLGVPRIRLRVVSSVVESRAVGSLREPSLAWKSVWLLPLNLICNGPEDFAEESVARCSVLRFPLVTRAGEEPEDAVVGGRKDVSWRAVCRAVGDGRRPSFVAASNGIPARLERSVSLQSPGAGWMASPGCSSAYRAAAPPRPARRRFKTLNSRLHCSVAPRPARLAWALVGKVAPRRIPLTAFAFSRPI